MTFELKPCPFCGQPAVGPIPLAEDGWRVHCGNDPSQCVWPYFDTSRSPDAAVSMWNSRRAACSSPETEVWRDKCEHGKEVTEQCDSCGDGDDTATV